MEKVVKKYHLVITAQLFMSNFKITIPKPCSANWANMKPLEQGRFCDSCKKEVLDFTQFSTSELLDYFKYPKGNVCGRINNIQLADFIPKATQDKSFKYLSYKFLVASSLTLLTSTKSYSKETSNPVNTYQDDMKSRKTIIPVKETDTLTTISGVVKDNNDGLPISGVSISIKGILGTVSSDADGKFKIQIKLSTNQKNILISKYLGYETMETEVSSANRQNLQIKLSPSVGLMGEVVVTGGIIVKKSIPSRIAYFFRRVFTSRY